MSTQELLVRITIALVKVLKMVACLRLMTLIFKLTNELVG